MDRIRLSTKGQLVIPRHLRAALRLEAGDTLEVALVDRSLG
ncbi:MAG: AbrB/MazE/SpoVT family DNA-binding domain-containing protein [Ardenticatenia bacterium]|nr:AbrB/MazE/SpoVT family DNA-binding domain-containing protein [Ardenticatenia bacterium]